MSFWDRIKQNASDAYAGLKTKAAQYNNSSFRDATMAICALVASADGKIEDSEKQAIGECITSLDALKVFPPADLIAEFNRFCDQINKDKVFGKVAVMGVVGKIKGKGEQPDTAVQIALAIANSDGDFADVEKKVVLEICRTLGLDGKAYVS